MLRRLALSDMDAAARMYRAAYDDRFPCLAGRHGPEDDQRYFRETVYPAEEVWGAFHDGALIGIVAFRPGFVDNPGFVDKLYVLPGRHRQGIGSALLAVPKQACQALQLWTFQSNIGARRFYEAQGFIAIRETDGRLTEEREPDVLYAWTAA